MYTAVGHITVYSGSMPAIHGITGNDWIRKRVKMSIVPMMRQ
ncbi:alkaline phosphatase family protein [Olivibacter sp. CPCC 100613]